MCYFEQLSYLSLPTSFPIADLARFRVKPKLYRTSCKVFRSTHPLIVSPTCPREALFVFPPSRPSNISSFTVELILSSPCSRTDPPSPAKVRLSLTLILFHLTIWRDGFVPFPFGKGGSGVLANCSLCGTEATLSFSAGPVYLDFSTESGLGSTSKFAIFPLLFSDSLSVLNSLSSPPPFLLSQSLWYIWQELSSLSSFAIRLRWVPGHSFLPWNYAAGELARRGALLLPSAISCSLSPPTSLIYSGLYSGWRRTVSFKFFDSQVHSVSTEKLVLSRHARWSSLVFAAMDTVFCEALISLELAESGILYQCLRSSGPRHLSSHSVLPRYKLFAPHALCVSTTSGPGPGELPGFWGYMVFHNVLIPRKELDNNKNNNKRKSY